MMGRVIFFPLVYWPPEEKLSELKAMQERLKFHHIEFINSIARFSQHEQMIRKQAVALNFRARWKVIHGEKVEQQCAGG
jgi:hypothetical protein